MLPEAVPLVAAFYANILTDTVPVIHTVDEIASWIIQTRLPRGSSYLLEEGGELIGWLDVFEGEVDRLFVRCADKRRSTRREAGLETQLITSDSGSARRCPTHRGRLPSSSC